MADGNLGMLSEAIIDVMVLVDGTKLLIEARFVVILQHC